MLGMRCSWLQLQRQKSALRHLPWFLLRELGKQDDALLLTPRRLGYIAANSIHTFLNAHAGYPQLTALRARRGGREYICYVAGVIAQTASGA